MVIDESGGQRTMSYQDKRTTWLKKNISKIDLYIADNCKHLVQWMPRFHQLATKFLSS